MACVGVRERDRERGRQRETARERETERDREREGAPFRFSPSLFKVNLLSLPVGVVNVMYLPLKWGNLGQAVSTTDNQVSFGPCGEGEPES